MLIALNSSMNVLVVVKTSAFGFFILVDLMLCIILLLELLSTFSSFLVLQEITFFIDCVTILCFLLST